MISQSRRLFGLTGSFSLLLTSSVGAEITQQARSSSAVSMTLAQERVPITAVQVSSSDDIRRQNVRTPDPNNPFFSLQIGAVASRGIEVYLGGEILPGWNVTAAYTYLDAFVSEDNTDIIDNRLPNVPDNQFSVWTTYEVQEGDLEGLGLGLGLFYVGDRQGDAENTLTVPSYLRTDAALFYARDNWRAQINFENVFNIEYFSSATFNSRFLVNPGAPFGISGSFSIVF